MMTKIFWILMAFLNIGFAAYDNRNIKTFPAMFPGVFGVRQDREGILENQEFIFQEIPQINTENSIIAHGWCNDGENHANSYAAPVITGQIARYSGFEQIIGQNGAKLSGGEQQKIAVARALLKQSDILILDEFTEGFDKESREKLLDTLYNDFNKKTIVFVTHREDELKYADRVFRIVKGKLELDSAPK